MVRTGFASQIITPEREFPLAGYFNKRPNRGFLDDLFVKVLLVEKEGVMGGFVVYDLCGSSPEFFDALRGAAKAAGITFADNLMVSCTHTHTGPEIRRNIDEQKQEYIDRVILKTVAALKEAAANLRESSFEVASVNSNPYAYVRRFWMKNGKVVTNPGKCNPDIVEPDGDYDRTITAVAVKQEGRIAAILVNLANHGDTIGGNLVSADWYGRFVQAVQHELKTSLPVLVLDDASGNINHFDFHQQINQTGYHEAVRVGRGDARIVLDALQDLKPVAADKLQIKNTTVTIPHRQLSDAEVAEAQHILDTVPDIKKDGDFESQDLANKVPAALRYFAQRALDCKAKSVPSHECRLTAIEIGDELAFVSLPGEPFNGIAEAIRKASPYNYTLIAELAQSPSGYVPMKECFARGGYEVQPGIDTVAPEAAEAIIEASIRNL